MTKDELKRRIFEAIDSRADEIIGIGERILKNPEMGFKEVKTAALVHETFQRLGLESRTGLAMTGVRADVRGRAGEGPTFALLGELDGLRVTGHPQADPATGAAHACGHNAQVAGMLGAAMGLTDTNAFGSLSGRVAFFAVPAEEGGDLEWRLNERRAGRLELLGGKRSEEHTSELQSRLHLVCRLLLEKKKKTRAPCTGGAAPVRPASRHDTTLLR